jgi:hypothetical protein
MKTNITQNAVLYRNATLGVYGHKILETGNTPDPLHEFIAVTAIENSSISYVKSDTEFPTYGDATVTALDVTAGLTLILGPIKNLSVISGKVIANLITRP